MDVAKLEDEISKFIYELENEDRLVRVGLKDISESSKVYKKHSHLFTKETLDSIKEQIEKAKSAKQKDILERIYFTLVGSYIGLQLAAEADKITTYFSKATVKSGADKIAYFEVAPRISKDPVYDRREQLDHASTSVVSKINPKQLSVLNSEIKLLKSLGYSGYLDFHSKAKKTDLGKFYKLAKKTLKDTDKLWLKTIGKVAEETLGRKFKNIKACHMSYLRSLSMFDNYYPKEKVVPIFEKWAKDIGLSDLLSTVKIDDVDRPKKNPRAVCYPTNPPKEVHLVIKPIGGEQDFEAMFHEGGHSLHFAGVDPSLPYTFRQLSYTNAMTEGYAFVLEDLIFDPEFLTAYLNVSSYTGNKIKWQAHFINLMMLRRYLGKFIYEYEMFSKNAIAKGPSLYVKTLNSTTGFMHKKENWLTDMDGGFYSSDYLRAWIMASQVKHYLSKKFGKRWFMNKKAGEFLRKLYYKGVVDEAEDVVKKLGYKPWDTSLLVKGYKETLA